MPRLPPSTAPHIDLVGMRAPSLSRSAGASKPGGLPFSASAASPANKPAPVGGLPPPTRGIHTACGYAGSRGRSTPAHAGNTTSPSRRPTSRRVYPRPRGEYLLHYGCNTFTMGLPPPTRGIPCGNCGLTGASGSTPAHAGNTQAHRAASARAMVYPRPRGEYLKRATKPLGGQGLPPPTRGIRIRLTAILTRVRSTPAHAGNTR